MSSPDTASDFDAALETVREYINDLNPSQIEEVEVEVPTRVPAESDEEPETVAETRLSIFPERREGPVYHVTAQPGERFFTIESHYNLVAAIADELDEDLATELLAENPIDVEEEELAGIVGIDELDDEDIQKIAASVSWLNGLDRDKVRTIIYGLSEIFATAPVKYRINALLNTSISGFVTREKIFPYEPEFTIRDFNQSVERVRLPAHLGQLYLKYTFNLGVNEADPNQQKVTTEISHPDESGP